MERPDAAGRGAGRWICLEWQDLPQPVEDRPGHHRHPLERPPVLWFARQTVEGGAVMKTGGSKKVPCAIYTRVSTDQGLEQDFNSLDAQYDASLAYIRSQQHAGWTMVRAKYDDGGFSGGNTDRPALQRLLEDVRAGKIDIIVVYKVDRLTRSLADFAKLVELFDQHDVSLESVTQQFNTTTSMGRLTLNVLLSFAQFEREVTSERIRDKIAASKRKGLWVGGMAPLGYDTKDRRITVNGPEAETVRTIFRSYLKLGSLSLLMADLRKRGIVTRVRTLKTGETVGGIPFTRGPLAHLLRNRFYIGDVPFKGEILKGEQPAIVDRDLFEAVQAKLSDQVNGHKAARMKSEALLIGRIFDDRGNRMSPSHARKGGLKYRYYLSSALLQGEPLPGSLVTVTSPPIIRTSLRVMARPRPVPPYCRAVEESAWVNSSNSLACCAGVIPMPVSATANSIQLRPLTTFLTCSVTSPCLVNLQALLNRLSRICRSRMGSTISWPRFAWASRTSRFLFCSASCRAVPMTSSSSGAKFTVSGLSSSLPASILERSSTWLMRPRRWVPARWTRRSGSAAFSVPKRGALFTIISVSPMMALSGVRSSWLMLATNCDLCWLANASWRLFSSTSVNRLAFWMASTDCAAKVCSRSTVC